MKSIFAGLVLVCVMIALPGCGSKKDNPLAIDGATADDFAKYEADLAAANADGTYATNDGDVDGDGDGVDGEVSGDE